MPYATGTANSLADILAAVQAACTGNGWTLSGTVLNKGSCYTSLAISGSDLQVQGGTGIDGSNALTTPGPQLAYVGATHQPLALSFPLTYHIHVLTAPDEVYVCLNYNTTYWQWLAFGISPVAGLPGTGGWYAASASAGTNGGNLVLGLSYAGTYYGGSHALFAQNTGWSSGQQVGCNSYAHVGLDGYEWALDTAFATDAGCIDAWTTVMPHLGRQPNAFNNQTVLLPIQPIMKRASSKVSQVLELGHSRYCRNDNYADGDVIALGPDSWKVYPFARKDATARNASGASNATLSHSGTFALAVRYDGP